MIGYGAGGLESEFERLTAGKTAAEGQLTSNPHNEYLLMAVQLGTLGLLLFVNLIVQIARGSRTIHARGICCSAGSRSSRSAVSPIRCCSISPKGT